MLSGRGKRYNVPRGEKQDRQKKESWRGCRPSVLKSFKPQEARDKGQGETSFASIWTLPVELSSLSIVAAVSRSFFSRVNYIHREKQH